MGLHRSEYLLCCRFSHLSNGSPKSRERVEYGFDDQEALAWWLSRRIPNKEAGGRQGNNVYKEMVKLVNIGNIMLNCSCY